MIDKIVHIELRRKYNPDGSELRRAQMRMLEMLKYIDALCVKNGIKFWLSSGTCLGAVRHGGFIPWDDDTDIEMLEDDYKKLVKVMENTPNAPYVLQTYKNDQSFFPRFGKLRDRKSHIKECGIDKYYKFDGIFIDIFPLKPSSSRVIHKLGYKPLRFLVHRAPLLYKNKQLVKMVQLICQITVSLLSVGLSLMQRVGKKKYLRHISPAYFSFPRCSTEIFPLVRMNFEGISLPVPRDCNGYLKRIYGENYMNLPPLDNISCHTTKIEFED